MNMKVSTAFLFDRTTQRMSMLQNRLATTQAQLSESKQILSPSDAPAQAAAIERLRGEIDRQTSHVLTLRTAMRRYNAEEAALKASDTSLVRIKELTLQAANDTLSEQDRRAVAVELKAMRDQLLSLGNTRDDSGNYLFSGTRVRTPAFKEDTNGVVSYQGDQTQTRIPAGVERTVAFTRAGTDVFSRVTRPDGQGARSVGFFDSLDQTIEAVLAGDTAGMRQGLNEVDQMQYHVNLSLAQTGSDQQVVQSQLDLLDQTNLRLKSTLSDIEDLDYTEAISRMNKEMMALEAAMTSFSKVAGLTLFDYVK